MTYGSGALPLAVAHRGGASIGLENTMEAFRRSTALGVRYLEFDVRMTRDGVPVLFHDPSIDFAGAPRRIADLTLAELGQVELAPGLWVPTLADVLHAFRGSNFMVDMKDPEALGPTLDLVEHYDAVERVCFTGGWDSTLDAARERFEGIHTALGWGRMSGLLTCGRTGLRASRWRSSATFVHIPLRLGRISTYLPRVVEMTHRLDLRLMVWGVEDTTTMHRLLDDGVDGIITDRPDLLREVLVARGQWSFAPTPTPKRVL